MARRETTFVPMSLEPHTGADNSQKPGRRRWRRPAVIVPLLLVTRLGFWLLRDATFEAERWMNAQADERTRMLTDLLWRNDPVGKTREQVEEQLGPSERVSGHELYTLRFQDAGAWREHFMFVPRRLEVKYDTAGVCTDSIVHPLARESRRRTLRWYLMRIRDVVRFE